MAASWISSTISRVRKSGSLFSGIFQSVVLGETTKEVSMDGEYLLSCNPEHLLGRAGR